MTFSDEVSFEFVEEVTIRSIFPRRGSTVGGTVVTVEGTNFRPTWRLSCDFGGVASPAAYINSTTARCRAPALPAGSVQLRVTNNGVDFTDSLVSSDGDFTSFDEDLVVERLQPDYGDVAGGTNVTVYGSGFPTDFLFCRFGALISAPGIPMTDGQAICTSPSVLLATSLSVELSSNNAEFSSSGKHFRYLKTPRLVSAIPNSGWEVGHIGANQRFRIY